MGNVVLMLRMLGSDMTQTVYGLISDSGDGTSHVRWFRNKDIVDKLLNDDEYCEQYGVNEGSPAETLTFPDDLDLTECGFSFDDDMYA